MSTKSSLFLTRDDEHWYYDCSDGSFTIEVDKDNVQYNENCTDENQKEDIVFEIKDGCELHKCLMYMMNHQQAFREITGI